MTRYVLRHTDADDGGTPPGPLYATHSAEHPDPRGIPCPEPAEDNSEGYDMSEEMDPWT
jgi:hypothetical protein